MTEPLTDHAATLASAIPYQYEPLQKDHIRLLRVITWARKDDSRPWLFDLQHMHVDHLPTYAAISYCWGDVQDLRPLPIIRDRALLVRWNAYDALRCLSYTKCHHWIWIDSVCIDQKNIDERNAQVAMMSRIYHSASCVVVWLGSAAQDIISTLKVRAGDLSDLSDLSGLSDRSEPEADASAAPAAADQIIKWFQRRYKINYAGAHLATDQVSRLFQLPYWKRLWVVQEIIFAKKLSVVAGEETIPWEILEEYFDMLQKVHPYRDTFRLIGFDLVAPRPEQVVERLVSRRQRFHTERIGSLEELLDTYHTSLCRDPRDKIFGLLEIWNRQTDSPFYADYSKNVHEVLVMTYAYIVRTQRFPNYPFFCVVLLGTLGLEQSASHIRSWLSPRIRGTDEGFTFRFWNRTNLAVPALTLPIFDTARIMAISPLPFVHADPEDLLSWLKRFCTCESDHRSLEEIKLLQYVDQAMSREDAEWMAGNPQHPINPWDEYNGARLYIDETCRLGLVSSSAAEGDFVHCPFAGENLMVSAADGWVIGRAYQGPYADSVAETMSFKTPESTTDVKIDAVRLDPVSALVLSVPIPKGIRGVTIM